MNFVQMKCPNCGADLEVENDIDSFYCKYCGTKILLEGQDEEVLKTKRHAKTMDSLKDMQKEYYEDRQRREDERSKKSKEAIRLMIIMFVAMLIFMLLREHGIL